MRTTILVLAAVSLLAPTVAASTTCATGGLLEYCFFKVKESEVGNDDGNPGAEADRETTLGQVQTSQGALGTALTADVVILAHEEEHRGARVTETEMSQVSLSGRVLYRTQFSIDVVAIQAREEGKKDEQASGTFASIETNDPLLRRNGFSTGFNQDAAGACRETYSLSVNLIADSIGLAPQGNCGVLVPWLDLGRVTDVAAEALA